MCKHHINESKICVNITESTAGKLEYVMFTSLFLIVQWYYLLILIYILIYSDKGKVAKNVSGLHHQSIQGAFHHCASTETISAFHTTGCDKTSTCNFQAPKEVRRTFFHHIVVLATLESLPVAFRAWEQIHSNTL